MIRKYKNKGSQHSRKEFYRSLLEKNRELAEPYREHVRNGDGEKIWAMTRTYNMMVEFYDLSDEMYLWCSENEVEHIPEDEREAIHALSLVARDGYNTIAMTSFVELIDNLEYADGHKEAMDSWLNRTPRNMFEAWSKKRDLKSARKNYDDNIALADKNAANIAVQMRRLAELIKDEKVTASEMFDYSHMRSVCIRDADRIGYHLPIEIRESLW